MLAVIRARFSDTSASAIWSDAAMHAWFDPNIPFSLAHYWTRTSFGGADMRYNLFPSVVVNDNRDDASLGGDQRDRLVWSVLDEVTRLFDPDWDLFDQFLICFAQQTDMFGGGAYRLKTRPGSDRAWITGAVVDIMSPFDSICQEVGHGFGFDHELGVLGEEYGCPYSVMSSSGQGSSFERPVDSRLPTGTMVPGASPFGVATNDPQRIVGPYIPSVHFYVAGFGPFKHPDSVIEVPQSFATSPSAFRLDALDKGVAAWPQRKRVLAVLPPLVQNGDRFFLELRRRGTEYDQGIQSETGGQSPAAITIYSHNATTGRIKYEGRIALSGAPGDRDFHSFRGFFTVRMNTVDADFGSVNLTVGGGDYWKHFGVDFDVPHVDEQPLTVSPWTTAHVAPCFIWPKADYQFRYHLNTTTIVMIATSYGFEEPGYTWFVNDQSLIDRGNITLDIQVREADAGQLLPAQTKPVNFSFRVANNRLELVTSAPYAGMNISVRASANEVSHSVLQNLYPEQTVWTSVGFDNLRIEWDANYVADSARCWKKFHDINDRFGESTHSVIPQPDPDPRFERVTVFEVLRQLVQTNPAAASIAIDEVAKLTRSTRLEVLKRM